MLNFVRLFIICILTFMCFWQHSHCFRVNFREYNAAKVQPFANQIHKREMSQFFDKASYAFNGFQKIESVPVLFPNDICLLNLEGVKYATALHRNRNGERHFAVFKFTNGNYTLLDDIATPNATTMDCKAVGAKGYVAIAFNITTTVRNAKDASPIYEIAGDRLRAVQYFATPNLLSVYLRVTGNDLFLLQTFRNTEATPNLNCPYFKWSGSTFNRLGHIPCSNARHLEPFAIDYENYVAVANYADQRGRTYTHSEIYKFVREKKSFQLFQKIKTNGAVDVRYFSVPLDEVKRHHFLIFGSSLSRRNKSAAQNEQHLEADSVFYVFDKGQFVPYQSLPLYAVEKFLPLQNNDAEKFLLLVACTNQDTKIYNLNDWKFEESDTQFTEGALGRGVANMRIYQENDNSYLVIANELMTDNDTNIFLPIFKQDEHANALRQQIIDWTKTNLERLQHIDVEKLKQDVEAKLATQQKNKITIQAQDIPTANIQTVVTESFVYPRLHLTNHYWKALSYAHQALDALQAEIEALRNRRKRALQDTKFVQQNSYDFEHFYVNTLVLHDKLKLQTVNGVEVKQPKFDSITAKRVIVTGSYQAPTNITDKFRMNGADETPDDVDIEVNDEDMQNNDVLQVQDLLITGQLNGYMWDNLVNNTLKRAGLQFVKAPTRINNLKAETVIVTSDEVSGQDLGKSISITGGNYVIDQDIKFEAPIKADHLVINERLNNIHVHQGKLDVLLKRANETQIITGFKNLTNLRVLEPITIAGQVRGEQLQSIMPHIVVHEDMVLNGDYTIEGDVIVSTLSAVDLIVPEANISVINTLRNGINMLETIKDVNIKFQQPIEANDSAITFINAQDLQQLVKTNFDKIQVIQGEKIFKNTLQIQKGFSEVKFLNGVDVESLDKRLLLKKANQTIDVPMHFGTIIAKRIQSPIITLNNRSYTDYLTKSGNQHIPAKLTVQNLHANNADIQNLQTNGRIFEQYPNELYQQKAKNAPNSDIFQENHKFHGNIYVRNLIVNTTINNKDIRQIEQYLQQLKSDIRFVGNYKFNYDMNITHLTFQGKLNGIPAAEFGRCWLQKTGAQAFTAPQTLSIANCDRGLLLNGTLNGYKYEDFFTNAIWINRDEYLGAAAFRNPIQMQGALTTSTLNGLHVPLDMLYHSSAQPQVLYTSISLNQNLYVTGGIFNTTHVNGISLIALERYLSGYDYDTLHLEHVNFVQPPYYHTLNHYNLQNLLDVVWLANENVYLDEHVELADAAFQGLLNFEGLINNLNLNYLKENYFSRSRPQVVNTELIFASNVDFLNEFHANALHLMGPVIESTSNTAFNFDEFVSNTLKTDGPHEIRAVWSILEAIVQGDLRNAHINNLNLAQDVLHTNQPYQQITAPKRLSVATINKLYATPTSTINNVPVANWIRDTVFVYENYTIQGLTTLDTVNMYNNLRVHGLVNNLTFNEQTLLLRDLPQTVHGNIRIHNIFPDTQRILVNSFEHLYAESVNGQIVAPFFANQAKLTPNVAVNGSLVFLQPLVVHEYHNQLDGMTKTKRRIIASDDYNKTMANWMVLKDNVKTLQQVMKTSHYILDHFEVRQTLKIAAKQIIYLPLYTERGSLDIIGILDETKSNAVQYYQWSLENNEFVRNVDLLWLPQNNTSIEIMEIVLEHANSQPMAKLDKQYYQRILGYEKEGLDELLQLKHHYGAQLAAVTIQNSHCIAVYGSQQSALALPIYCLQQTDTKLQISLKTTLQKGNVKQVLALTATSLAVLLEDAVEIWQTNETLRLTQRIPVMNAQKIAVGEHADVNYLAIMTSKSNSLQHGNIEIYRSVNVSYYQQLQSLDCIEPQQVFFSALQQSNDLLLHALTGSKSQPLIIYQYNGVAGFEQIVGASVLPTATRMQLLPLQAAKQQLIALVGNEELTFVEIVLKKF